MKSLAVIAAIAMVSFTTNMEAERHGKKHKHHQVAGKHHSSCSSSSSSSRHVKISVPSGSYYADLSVQNPSQTVVLTGASGTPPLTVPVHFSGTNVNNRGVTLLPSGNSISVPKKGVYKIEWNASLSFIQSPNVHYHFDLQKNGTTLLHPIPQVIGEVGDGLYATPLNSAAASVIVSLQEGDTISLLLTIDGSEGNNIGDGVQIDIAQISATLISPLCD